MAQVSYGTITITDTNDIERIYMVYAGSSSDTTAPDKTNFNLWKADITQVSGDYIWQRTVIKKSGIDITSSNFQNYYGDPVCITGPEGAEGAAARKITSVTPYYYLSTSNSTQTGGSWSTTPAAYPASGTYYYWTKTVTAYDSGNPSESSPVLDRALNSANETARSANSTAAAANSTANQANTTAGEAKTIAEGASSAISDLNQYFWRQKTAVTNVPAGSYVTNVPGTTYKNNPASGGFNSLVQASGIFLRNGITTLSSWTGDALIFYNPSTNSKAIELGTKNNVSTLSFYNPSNESISMMDLTSAGLVFKTSAGAEIGKFGSDSSGGLLELSGRLNIKGGGRIGQDSDNYWEFGDNRSYDSNDSAYLIGKGTASLQLGETGHWRLDKNRIHTGWYQLNDKTADTPAGSLHFDIGTESGINYYWDYGMHYPDKAGGGNNKFLYIRRSNDSTSTALGTMKSRIDDDSWWTYKFYVDGDGNLHAGDVYSHGTLISGTSAPYLLKSGGTMTGNITMSNGAKLIGDVTGNVSGSAGKLSNTSKIGDTNKPVYFSANGVPVAISYEINKSVPSNAIFTDQNVKTDLASNGTTFYIAGPTSTATTTGTLKVITGAKVTIDGSGKATITATTFSGNLSGTATKANQDGDGNVIKSTYLKLSGGNVTGAVSFGSSVSMDEATIGDLVVNGSASFTNNLQVNTINGVAVGSSPKFTDTVTTVTTSGNGNAVTAITASNGKLTVTKGTTFLTSYTETDPVFVASAAHGITSSDISNWNSKTSNTGTVTSVRVQASSPLTSTTSTASSTTLDTTIKFANQNKNLVLAGPSSGSAAAPTFRSLVADDIPGLAWSKITSGKPTTLSGYGITDAVPSSRKVAGHALSADVTLDNSDVGLSNVINAKQITNITNEFKDGQNTGKLVIWRGESDSEVLEVQITAREATSATNATNAQYATYDASEASNTTKTTIANKYIAKSIGTAKGDIIYWTGSGTPTRLAAGTNGHFLKLVNGVPTWVADNNDNTWRGIQVNGTDILGTGTNTNKLNLKAGSNVTISNNNGTVTIASSYTNTDTLVTQTNTTDDADYRLLFSANANDSNETTTSRKSTYLKFNPSSGLLKTYGISSTSGSTPVIYSDVSAAEIKAADSSLTTNSSDLDWLKALLIALCNKYPGRTGCIFKGTMSPNSVGWYEVHIYNTSTKDSTTGLPQYSFGRFLKYINNYELFGTASYSYSYRTVDTNTWNALSTSQAGYVSQAPNDTTKFLRGDAQWAQVSSANLSDIRLTWSGSVSTTDWILAHDTAASGTPLFRAMSPANLKTTMSLNNVENTALSTWTGSNKITTLGTITTGTWNGSAIPVANGGTGATTAANARTNLGLGSAATYTASTSVGNNSNLPTGAAVQTYVTNAISGASNTYVTIATDQTITASQKTFNGAIRWGTASKYGAVNYNSTLDALVFSFA